ncbi:MAG: hypothetical protein ACKVSF_09365 [Alphaproteobacteria bacterium]
MAGDTEAEARGVVPAVCLVADCEPIDLDRAARDPVYRRFAIKHLAAEEKARCAPPSQKPAG